MKVVALTGAGISAESGIATFRGSDGLWEGWRFEEVATPEAWERDPEMVLRFYNMRRRQVAEAKPNAAHLAIAKLADRHDVTVITQNVDDLHERAESERVIHLHGEIMKVRSSSDPTDIIHWGARDLEMGDLCSLGSQLRPHIVWFGEDVPEFARVIPIVLEADVLLVVGTSLKVYPAAGLVDFVRPGTPVFVVDPDSSVAPLSSDGDVRFFTEPAAKAVPAIVEELNRISNQQEVGE